MAPRTGSENCQEPSLESSVGGNTGKGVLGVKENGAHPKP